MYDSRALANAILDQSDLLGIGLTNLSLQKVAYFCHGWSLAVHGSGLSKQDFEAWQYGPVLQNLYREFKSYDRRPIDSRCMRLDPSTGNRSVVDPISDPSALLIIQACVKFYGGLRAGTLVEMSHDPGGAWDACWREGEAINPGMRIDNVSIRQHFLQKSRPF